MEPGNEVIGAAVPGGTLAVELIGSQQEPVLAVHGISSQRKLWNWLRAAEPDPSLIAPDLRGRGDSAGVQGRSSIAQHAADLVAVLDHLGLAAVHVCGMSMGGFVAAEMATVYPSRVKSLILIDGGFPLTVPPGLTPDAMPVVFRDRLDHEWPSVREYARFFVPNTAPLLDPGDPLLLDYLAHDLARRRGQQRCQGRRRRTRPVVPTRPGQRPLVHHRRALFDARRLAYPALERLGPVLTEDVCVPRSKLPAMLEQVSAIGARYGVQIATIAHAGDGNLHPLIITPPGDEAARAAAQAAFDELLDAAIAFGGTVTGEHGVGLLKRDGMHRELDPGAVALQSGVRRALDPLGIFNPGKG